MKQYFPLLFLFVFQSAIAQIFAPDPNFGINGRVENGFTNGTLRLNTSVILQNGSIISAGNNSNFTTDFVVTKNLASGVLDNNFGNQGYVNIDYTQGAEDLKSIALQADGKILVGGSTKLSNKTSSALTRLHENGTIDTSFGENGLLKFLATGTTSLSVVEKIVVLSDGKILVGGYLYQNNVYRGYLRRYLSNGTLDTLFGTSGQSTINFAATSASSYVYDIIPETDGKITVYGQNYATRFILGIARLSSNGVLDASFSTDGVLTHSFATGQNYATRIFKLADGKYVIVGYANSSASNYKVFSSRFSVTGDPDNGYGTNGTGNYSVNSSYTSGLGAAILSDESLLIAGEAYFTNIYNALVYKVSPGGTLETSFATNGYARINSGSNSSYGNSVLVSGNNIFLTGSIYSSSANSNYGLVAGLQNTGTALVGFGTNGQASIDKTNSNTRAKHLDKTSDGQYIVSGDVVNYDADQFKAKFNANGSKDNSFANQGVSVQDFGSVENYEDRVDLNNGEFVQLSAVGDVSLAFTGLGTFSSTSDYSLVRTGAQGIQAATNKKFRFSSTEFTQPKVVRKDPQGNIYVLADQAQPTKSACYISKHLASNLALDNTFGTSGKYQLYGFSFPTVANCFDFQIDNNGNIYTLRYSGNTPGTAGFRLRKYNPQMVADLNFATLSGELVVEPFSAKRLYIHSNGFIVSGSKSNIASLARISLTGQLLGIISIPEFKSISKIVIDTDGSFYVAGLGQNDKFRLVKFLADGSAASTFNGSGSITDSYFNNAVSIQDFVLETGGTITILARTREGLEGEKVGLLRLVQVTSTEDKIENINQSGFVYPNPASEKIYWQPTQNGELPIISIIDISGKKIGSSQATSGEAGLDIQHLPKGKYWLSIQGSKERNLLPFLKN
jgi:uncharacterized delta-60 repeat protein